MDSFHLFLFVSLWCSFSVMEFWKASILWRSIWICISLHVLVFQIRPEAIQKLFSMGCLQRLWNLHKPIEKLEKNKVLNLLKIEHIGCTSVHHCTHCTWSQTSWDFQGDTAGADDTWKRARSLFRGSTRAFPEVLPEDEAGIGTVICFGEGIMDWMCANRTMTHSVLCILCDNPRYCRMFPSNCVLFWPNSFSLSILVDSIVCWLCHWHPRLQFLGLLLLRRLRFGFAV